MHARVLGTSRLLIREVVRDRQWRWSQQLYPRPRRRRGADAAPVAINGNTDQVRKLHRGADDDDIPFRAELAASDCRGVAEPPRSLLHPESYHVRLRVPATGNDAVEVGTRECVHHRPGREDGSPAMPSAVVEDCDGHRVRGLPWR